jgi:hypothetical protein
MLRLFKVVMLSMLFGLTACQMMESKPEQLPTLPTNTKVIEYSPDPEYDLLCHSQNEQ